MSDKLPARPVRPSAPPYDMLQTANRMLTVAAQERTVMRTALQGCISALEDLQEGHPSDPLFEPHGAGTKALKHARQLLRPRDADHPTATA